MLPKVARAPCVTFVIVEFLLCSVSRVAYSKNNGDQKTVYSPLKTCVELELHVVALNYISIKKIKKIKHMKK